MKIINWDKVQLIADRLQDHVFTESVTVHEVSEQSFDDPHSEPETEPTPIDIAIDCGVSVSNPAAEIRRFGQEIEADYILFVTKKELNNKAVDIDRLIKNTVTIRGDECVIVKTKPSGWTGTDHVWLTIGAKRIPD